MAAKREDRFLMRQRGAGIRQLKDFGFDIAVPRPRRTPQRRTPIPRPSSAKRSAKRTPATSGKRKAVQKAQGDDGSSGRKGGNAAATPQTEEPEAVQDEPTWTGPAMDDIMEEAEIPLFDSTAAEAGTGDTDLDTPRILSATSGKKRKKRVSIGQTSRKRVRTSLPSPTQIHQITSPITEPSTAGEPTKKRGRPSIPKGISPDLPTVALQATIQERKPKRKKRTSIGKLPKQRKGKAPVSNNAAVFSPPVSDYDELEDTPGEIHKARPGRGRPPRKSLRRVEKEADGESEGGDAMDEDIEEMNREEAEDEWEDEGEAEVEGHNDGESEQDSDPAGNKQGKRVINQSTIRKGKSRRSDVATASSSKTVKTATKKSKAKRNATSTASAPTRRNEETRKGKVGSIPITVYRLSRPRGRGHESEEEDDLARPAPFPKNGSVNAIDVLSQICREMINKTLASMQKGAENDQTGARKAEWKRKRQAVELFRDELNARLFQMTEALDSNYALNVRLKQANKEKASARDALLAVRREREEIALRLDAVRSKHATARKLAEDEDELNNMLQDFELAVQRGRALPPVTPGIDGTADDQVGLEFRLREVAANVSSQAGRPGLLDEVKAFNAYLESAITAI